MARMIKIKGFDSYFFCLKTCKVISFKGKNEKELKPSKNWTNQKVFIFSRNGVKYKMDFVKILQLVIKEIESKDKKEVA